MEDRYVMLVDENGEPYLAHAGFLQRARTAAGNAVNSVRSAVAGRGGTRQNHKYLMKIGSPDNPRYLYTQEEVRAYLRGGRNALNNMANKAGQTAKNAVNTVKRTAGSAKDITRNAGRMINETVDNVKESTGIPAKNRMKESNEALNKANAQWEKDYKTALAAQESRSNLQWEKDKNGEWQRRKLTPEQQRNLNAAKAAEKRASDKLHESTEKVHEATEADVKNIKAYKESPLYDIDKKKEELSKKASEVKDNLKSKYDNMREEFRKRNEERKAETEPKSEEQDWKDNRPAGRTRNVTRKADPIEAKKKAKYGEYNENDPDFSDANYEKAKSIGDSDFSHFKRPDGTSVILEEDMKWVLPKGVDANNPKIRKAIQRFADQVESARTLGKENYTGDEWLEGVNKAIDEAVEEIQKDNKRSSGR